MNHMDKKCWANRPKMHLFCKKLYILALTSGFPKEQGKVFDLQALFPGMSLSLTVKACSNLLLQKETWNMNNEITEL